AHGLPVEGAWYTSVFRNAVIGRLDKDNHLWRTLQDLKAISVKSGGDVVNRDDMEILYAGVLIQYFASVVVVDNQQVPGQKTSFPGRGRPTLESWHVRGTVKGSPKDGKLTIQVKDSGDQTFSLTDAARTDLGLKGLSSGEDVTVWVTPNSHDQLVATEVQRTDDVKRILYDDITVRMTTEPIELAADGQPVVHKYLLYNGPVKVRL